MISAMFFVTMLGFMALTVIMWFNDNKTYAVFASIGALVCLLLAFGTAVKEGAEQTKANFVDVSKCEVIGSAQDQTRGATIYRKIYKCPDDLIHIR